MVILLLNFNSTMVRLKVEGGIKLMEAPLEFQFHDGTIKRLITT